MHQTWLYLQFVDGSNSRHRGLLLLLLATAYWLPGQGSNDLELIPRTSIVIFTAHLSLWKYVQLLLLLLLLFTVLLHLIKPFILNPCYSAVFQNKNIRRCLLRLASPDSARHCSGPLHHLGPFLTFSGLPSVTGTLHVCPGPVRSWVVTQLPALPCTFLFSFSAVVGMFSDTTRASLG